MAEGYLIPTTDFLGRQIVAEEALIGCAILDVDYTRESCGWLKPEAFHDSSLGATWGDILAGVPPVEACYKNQQYGAGSWQFDCVSWTYATVYAKAIAHAAQLRSMGTSVARLTMATADGDHDAAMEIVQELAKQPLTLLPTLETAIDVGAEFLASLDQPVDDIPTHIPPLDAAIGGLERGNLSILAARPSMGKSALAWQIARSVAASGRRVVMASLEMNRRELWSRAACGAVGVSYRDVRHKRITQAQREQLRQVCSDLMFRLGPNLIIETSAMMTTADLWQVVTQARPDLVVTDHISLFGDRGDNENQRLGDITWRLKQMSKQFDCHVLAVAQLNRQADMRANAEKRPQLTDLRDSGEIEQNADLVLMLYREGYYDPKKDGEDSATELWVRKNRNGESHVRINLTFRKLAQWFDAPEDADDRQHTD